MQNVEEKYQGEHMSIDLPLDSMTTSEKLHLMESIWDSLIA